MNEGNLFNQQQKHQQSRKLFSSSRDSELELLDTTETSSPEIRSRSQSVSSTHREALLFFEQNRLFQNSPELEFGREESYGGDCELRSISSASRTSSPAIVGGAHHFHQEQQSTEKDRPNYQQRQQKSGNCNLLCHQQQVHRRHKNAGLRQQSDSNLLESAGSSLAAVSFLTGAANIGCDNQTNSFNDPHSSGKSSSGDRGGRARSQSQGQCGSVRRRQESCSSVIIVSTDNKNGGESGSDTTQKASKWLEEIQFKAQYQHYRTNNYASVVSSASSLDKSDGGTGSSGTTAVGTCVIGSGDQPKNAPGHGTSSGPHSTNKNASEAERPSSSKPGGLDSTNSSNNSRHRHHSHQFTKSCNQQQDQEQDQEDEAEEELQYLRSSEERKDCEEECINSENLNRQNSITTKQCWNFPRVKLRKLFTAKSLDDILGGGRSRSASGSSRSGLLQGRKKSLQVAGLSSSSAHEEFSQDEVSGERSSSSPDFVIRTSTTTHTKKAQLLRDNKLSLFQQNDDGVQLLIVKPVHDGSKSPGAHSSKSAIVISTTAPSKQRKGPVFIKANRQKSRSFSALTSAILSRVPGHHSSGANSPCNSTTSSANAGSSSGLSVFFKRSHQENKNIPPVVPPKKSGHIVPCAKSDNCLNRFVASATCAKFVDYFSAENSKVHKSATSTTPVEPFTSQQQSSEYYPPGSSSAASSSPAFAVVTAQPRKWTAIKNKWDQKLQASGDRQKEIGASLASVSNNAQIFRKTHHHHQPRQRSSSLSPLDNPEDGKSIESLLEITSPSPTLQEVRFLDTPEIRYASPIAVRSSRGEYHNVDYDDDDEDDNNEDESVTLIEGATSIINSSIVGERDSRTPSRASSACSSYTASSLCSECKDSDNIEDEENDTVGEMTRHQGNTGATAVGGKKRSRDHHHHHRHDKHSSSKEKPKLVVANVTYLQRPMSPGLVLRESSPSSSTVSGTIDAFGLAGGNSSGAGRGAEAGGNLYSPSVIRNNNVFTNNNNQPSSQSKSQQAKLEFLKSFSASQSYEQQNVIGSDCSRKRDPLCANNSSIVNANERQASCGAVGFISPSSSSGASDIRSSGSVGVGIIGTNNAVVGGRSNIRPTHQPFLLGDLQDPFLTNRQRDHFTDAGLTEASGGVIRGYDACDGANNSNRSRGAPSGGGVDEQQRGSQPPRLQQRGAEHCSNLDQARSYVIDSHSERRHHSHQGAGQGDSGAACGSRSTDTQPSTGGGRDTGNPPGEIGEGRVSSATLNQGALAQQSSINNNLFVDVDFEDTEDTMGDLQSPQYVKRTAHMFDSRFSTEPDANAHDRRNPSYLNVSRSVSGYSCLTYNNGSVTSETVTKSVLGNGASLLTSGARVTPAATRLKSDFSIHPPFSRNKVPNTDDDSSDHSSNQSATSPPPSLPPINTTTGHGRFSDSPFFQNGTNRGDDLIDDTPYIPSHGKSFIMQRIERLYGTDAVSNKAVVTRKSSNVTTISITRESPTRGNERVIPIKVESRDDHQNNLYNSGRSPNKNESSRHEQQAFEEDGKISSDMHTTSVIIPIIRSSDNSRSSRVSTEDTDEEEDTRNATKRRSPAKSMGHLNGNANRYRNDESRATNGNECAGAINGSSITLVKNVHANGNEDCTPTPLKTALSRESSTGSDDTNDLSENSLELGSISSDVESRKSVVNRQDSKEDSLYSSRGASSPSKPKPKPKPKDMALLRTLSRSPALKTGTENLDKTAISYSIVPSEAASAVSVSKLDDNIKISEDQTDADNFSALSDIKNTISAAAAKSIPQGKVTPPPPAADKSSHQTTPTGSAVDKENTVSRVSENEKVLKTANSAASPTASFSVKDGNYFLNEMKKVAEEILKLSGEAAKELDTIDESEDRAGSIHAAVGKGNLLVKKKFKQFEELCHANLRGKTGDEPETTDEDLAGFWDMVMIQVEQVYTLFADLKKKQTPESVPVTPLKTASPKRVPVSTSKSSTKSSVGATPKVNSAAAKARDEARRKLLAEKRKAMKNQLQDAQEPMVAAEPEAEIQIFAPETPQTG